MPLGLNFITKCHATRVIYQLTVQTLPDGLETQFTPPDTAQTALSCRVRVNWALYAAGATVECGTQLARIKRKASVDKAVA